jgi:MoaA/NifB/PqqE/SkfB family radical SAM enzyme
MRFDPQAKLLWHGDRVMRWLITGKTTPVLVEVSPTGYCNAACPWCFFKDKKSTEQIDSKVMISTIEDMAQIGVRAINWSGGGEPTLHPDFGKFVDWASHNGLKQGLFTNAYNKIPNQKSFEWIRISLTDKGFKAIKRPSVPFGICVNHIPTYFMKDLEGLCLKARRFGASYFQVRPALVGDYKEQPYICAPDYLKALETSRFAVHITHYKYDEAAKPKYYKDCYGYHLCPSIDWRGKVSVCMYLTLDGKYNIGDLNKTSFADIWKRVPREAKVTDRCQNCCKNHEINKILYSARSIKSVDFL